MRRLCRRLLAGIRWVIKSRWPILCWCHSSTTLAASTSTSARYPPWCASKKLSSSYQPSRPRTRMSSPTPRSNRRQVILRGRKKKAHHGTSFPHRFKYIYTPPSPSPSLSPPSSHVSLQGTIAFFRMLDQMRHSSTDAVATRIRPAFVLPSVSSNSKQFSLHVSNCSWRS